MKDFKQTEAAMKELAEEFCKGEIQKTNLKKRKAEVFASLLKKESQEAKKELKTREKEEAEKVKGSKPKGKPVEKPKGKPKGKPKKKLQKSFGVTFKEPLEEQGSPNPEEKKNKKNEKKNEEKPKIDQEPKTSKQKRLREKMPPTAATGILKKKKTEAEEKPIDLTEGDDALDSKGEASSSESSSDQGPPVRPHWRAYLHFVS